MALTQVTGPYPIFTDLDGTPLDDGYLYIGDVNQDPEQNPIQVYWDANLTIPASQPIRTSNGYAYRNGTPALIYTAGAFSITIRNKREEFVLYSPVGYGFDPAAVSASVVQNDFTGDGVEVDFTLSASPSTKLATSVFINGVYQEKDSYSILGNVLTFTVAPPLSSGIEVMTNETGVIGSTNASLVSYTAGFAGATAQTVQTKLEQYVSVKDFGAVGDGVADDTAAIQAALNASVGGDVWFPAGIYKVTATLTIPPRVRLIGNSKLQGGSSQIVSLTANPIFSGTPVSGSTVIFDLLNMNIQGGRNISQQFFNTLLVWSYSTIQGCYLVNIRKFQLLMTGNHFINNNFQNTVFMELRGSDCDFISNYIGFDTEYVSSLVTDGMLEISAASAFSFVSNYISSFPSAPSTIAPIPVRVVNSNVITFTNNRIDGGSGRSLEISAGSSRVVCLGNRIASIATNPPVFFSNVTQVTFNDNMFDGLTASQDFASGTSVLLDIIVHNNQVNTRTDTTAHDFNPNVPTDARVSVISPNLMYKNTVANIDITTPLFGRVITNTGGTGIQQLYFYPSRMKPTDMFYFSNTGARLVVTNADTSTNVYDSSTSGYTTGKVMCYVAGTAVTSAV